MSSPDPPTTLRVDDLMTRWQDMEAQWHQQQQQPQGDDDDADGVRSSRRHAIRRQTAVVQRVIEEHALHSARWKWVPATPYHLHWTIGQRAAHLDVHHHHHDTTASPLCRALIVENRHVVSDVDPSYPRFACVVYPCTGVLDKGKLVRALRGLRRSHHGAGNGDDDRVATRYYDLRIATTADTIRLTRAVTAQMACPLLPPHGNIDPNDDNDNHNNHTITGGYRRRAAASLPVILSKSIVPLRYFWMDVGHWHAKLGLTVSDFCRAVQPVVAEIEDPHEASSWHDDVPGTALDAIPPCLRRTDDDDDDVEAERLAALRGTLPPVREDDRAWRTPTTTPRSRPSSYKKTTALARRRRQARLEEAEAAERQRIERVARQRRKPPLPPSARLLQPTASWAAHTRTRQTTPDEPSAAVEESSVRVRRKPALPPEARGKPQTTKNDKPSRRGRSVPPPQRPSRTTTTRTPSPSADDRRRRRGGRGGGTRWSRGTSLPPSVAATTSMESLEEADELVGSVENDDYDDGALNNRDDGMLLDDLLTNDDDDEELDAILADDKTEENGGITQSHSTESPPRTEPQVVFVPWRPDVVSELYAKLTAIPVPPAAEMQATFEQLDRQQRGRLTMKDVETAMIQRHPSFGVLPPTVILRAFQKADGHDEGALGLEEFFHFVRCLTYFTNLMNIFEEMDTNKDRRLSRQEFLAAADVLEVDDARAVFDEMSNSSTEGYIVFDDFCLWMAEKRAIEDVQALHEGIPKSTTTTVPETPLDGEIASLERELGLSSASSPTDAADAENVNREEEEGLLAAQQVEEKRRQKEEEAAEEAKKVEEERLTAEAKRLEEGRLETERAEAEAEARRLEEERLAAEKAAEEKRLEQERIAAEEAEAKRLEDERLAAELAAEQQRLEEEKITADQAAAEAKRLEEERVAAEKAVAEQASRLEDERNNAKKAAEEAIAVEKVEGEAKRLKEEVIAAEKRSEEERLETERRAAEEPLATEKRAEEERLETEKVATDRAASEAKRLDEERIAADHTTAEKESLEEERMAAENAESEAKRLEQERIAVEQAALEAKRLEEERIAADKAAFEAKLAEEERVAAEADAERLEEKRYAAAKAAAEAKRKEDARLVAEAEANRLHEEQVAAEKAAAEAESKAQRFEKNGEPASEAEQFPSEQGMIAGSSEFRDEDDGIVAAEDESYNRSSSLIDPDPELKAKLTAIPIPEDDTIEAIFEAVDRNGDGLLSFDEVEKAIIQRKSQFDLPPTIVLRAFEMADADGDRAISRQEFFQFIRCITYFKNLKNAFSSIDTDHNQRLSKDEFHAAAKALDVDDPDSVFTEMDENNGGYIVFDEFCIWMAAHRTIKSVGTDSATDVKKAPSDQNQVVTDKGLTPVESVASSEPNTSEQESSIGAMMSPIKPIKQTDVDTPAGKTVDMTADSDVSFLSEAAGASPTKERDEMAPDTAENPLATTDEASPTAGGDPESPTTTEGMIAAEKTFSSDTDKYFQVTEADDSDKEKLRAVMERRRKMEDDGTVASDMPKGLKTQAVLDGEIQAKLDRRRALSDDGAIVAEATERRRGTKKEFGLDAEVQAKLDRRRSLSDDGSNITDEVDKKASTRREGMRSVQMSNDLQAIMARRRQAADAKNTDK